MSATPERRTFRRKIASISMFGTTQLHYRNPWVIAWWSAAFPGTGHLLLQKYMRGFLLFIWEMFVNTKSQLNLAMVYSFNGQIDQAKAVLDLRWMALYAPVYLFTIYDSYRSCVDMNKFATLARFENAPIRSFCLGPFEINYLDKRKPAIAFVWSLLAPGMGYLYAHRIVNALFATVTWIVFVYYSKLYVVIYHSLLGQFAQAKATVDWEWFMYIPSIYLFTAYDAYASTVESNKLFELELKQYFREAFGSSEALPRLKS
jgi:TM2 domain-containing membrane protein YozV